MCFQRLENSEAETIKLISLPVSVLNKSVSNSITSNSLSAQEKESFAIINLLKKTKFQPTPEPQTGKSEAGVQRVSTAAVLRAGSPPHLGAKGQGCRHSGNCATVFCLLLQVGSVGDWC